MKVFSEPFYGQIGPMLGYVGCKLGHFGRAKINQTKTFHLRFVLEAMLGQCWAFVRHVWRKNRLKETGFTRFFQFVFQKSGETMYGILILVAMLGFVGHFGLRVKGVL